MRLKNILLSDLIRDRLIAYEKIEEAMNSTNGIEGKVKKAKDALKQVTAINLMITTWEEIMSENVKGINKIEKE